EDAEPIVARCRRIPQALLSKVKDELERLEQESIIEKIEEPTSYCGRNQAGR
ncbi:hypothetical protein JTB14_031499, partial [Gonioctena quinquepunctata]